MVFDARASRICSRPAWLSSPITSAAARRTPEAGTTRARAFDHLMQELARIDVLGGEGLMLLRPRMEVRGRPLGDVIEGEELPRCRGSRHWPSGRQRQAQGPTRSCLEVELPNGTKASRWAPASRMPGRGARRRSAVSSPSAIRNCPRVACRGSRAMWASTPRRATAASL